MDIDIKVKKLADSGELKELKYIFVDSLDVDPTFVRYEEDYNYCKSIPDLLEKHIELTPFSYNKEDWNEAYWTKLKMDLIKNFSDERMTHMRLVAKTFLAEKVERILRERNNNTFETKKTVVKAEPLKVAITSSASGVTISYPSKQEQEREQEKVRKELERKNREFEEQQEAERRRREELRRRMAEQNNNSRAYRSSNNTNKISKKAVGIAVAAVAVALTAVAIYVLLK